MIEIPYTLLEKLSKANSIVVLTGAGVSAESGVKTFRDPDGLWAEFNPMELASIDGFMSNPQRVWSWYQYRVEIVKHVKPNPGHYAIAEMEKLFNHFVLITQNVDRLHQTAGSSNPIELHGNIIENHCFNCKKPFYGETALPNGEIPKCEHCGGLIRPSVVWFGEMLPFDALVKAEDESANCDVFFSVGTSAEVYPSANLPFIAKRNGATLVEVNTNLTKLSNYVDYRIAVPSGESLPILLEKYKEFIRMTK
jgi:NAD-dependent deacetylase